MPSKDNIETVTIERREEWAEIPYGVLGHRGPSSSERFASKAELFASKKYGEDDDPYGITPARCEVVTIDGREYRSRWVLVPTAGQLREHPQWPVELELDD